MKFDKILKYLEEFMQSSEYETLVEEVWEYENEWHWFHEYPESFSEWLKIKYEVSLTFNYKKSENNGDGRMAFVVYKVPELDMFIKLNYTYSSWSESEYDEEPFEVFPRPITEVKYFSAGVISTMKKK